MKQLWLRYRSFVLFCLAMAVLYAVLNLAGIGCPIRFLTGISCPGCGMTRAMWQLLTLDLSAALEYHPLCVMMIPVAALWLYFDIRRKPRATRILLGLTAGALVAVYLWRMLAGGDSVVVFSPREGFLYRLFSRWIPRLSP